MLPIGTIAPDFELYSTPDQKCTTLLFKIRRTLDTESILRFAQVIGLYTEHLK